MQEKCKPKTHNFISLSHYRKHTCPWQWVRKKHCLARPSPWASCAAACSRCLCYTHAEARQVKHSAAATLC